VNETLIRPLEERAALLHSQRGQLLDAAQREQRGLLASEQRGFDASQAESMQIKIRVDELREEATREAAAAACRVEAGATGSWNVGLQSGYHVGGGETYHRGESSSSFFRDLIHAQRGDLDAAGRLQRNNHEVGLQQSRALGNTGAIGGSGGEFAPPAWLTEQFVKLARPGRVTADLFHKEPLPAGVATVNIPRVGTGTTAAVQTTQNTALSQTDLSTNALSSNIVTIGGKQVVSQQLLDQSGVPFDRVVLEDLAADYGRQVGAQALTGTGLNGQLRGVLTPASTNVVTWTNATPTAAGFYAKLAQLQGQIGATRYAAPDAVVMHPRRWAWFASFTDSTGRPLVVPTSGGFNSMADPAGNAAAGHVGSVLGMDVFTDPNIPVNLGAGTNQDIVLVLPRDDVWLWESDLRAEAFTAPYADTLGVLYRCFNYLAMVPDRYLASLGQITGTGLVTPVFAN